MILGILSPFQSYLKFKIILLVKREVVYNPISKPTRSVGHYCELFHLNVRSCNPWNLGSFYLFRSLVSFWNISQFSCWNICTCLAKVISKFLKLQSVCGHEWNRSLYFILDYSLYNRDTISYPVSFIYLLICLNDTVNQGFLYVRSCHFCFTSFFFPIWLTFISFFLCLIVMPGPSSGVMNRRDSHEDPCLVIFRENI